MTVTAAFVVGFFIGWLSAWGLFALIVKWTRPGRSVATPTTDRLDKLHKAVYGRERADDARRRAH
jgi:hypothetical protein